MRKETLDEIQRSIESEATSVELYSFGNAEFSIETADKTVREYIHDVIAPHTEEATESGKKYTIVPVRTSYDVVSRFSERQVIETSDTFEYGKLDEDTFYLSSPFGFTHITHEGEEVTTHYCFSPRPELGAVAFVRSELMKLHSQKPNALIFHAASMVDENGMVTAFSGIESVRAYGNRAGKTTALLAATVSDNPTHRFFSNDELLTSVDGDRFEIVPFPNQIPVLSGTLSAIKAEGIKIPVDFLVDRDKQNNEQIYYTTAGQLQRSGFETARTTKGINNWVFTNLDPNQTGNSIIEVSPEQALEMFRTSVFPRRMNQSRATGYKSEMYRNYNLSPEDFEKADKTHEALVKSGTRFWILSRGVDRKSIQTALESIK